LCRQTIDTAKGDVEAKTLKLQDEIKFMDQQASGV
jgi:hypothetical protein